MDKILKERSEFFPKCLYYSFDKPIFLEKAKDHYYYSYCNSKENNESNSNDEKILDLYNNVCHIGHSNEKISKIIEKEYKTININTRYLQKNLTEYAKKLKKYLPIRKDNKDYKILFVNSGSEANDLALRILKLNQNKKKTISLTKSYHGTTYLCDKISHIYSTGLIKDKHFYENNEDAVFVERNNEDHFLNILDTSEKDINGCIIETIQGVGGNFPLSKEFMTTLFRECKERDIPIICDEVQTGFGRTGHSFWAFSHFLEDNYFPDIITCGKPIANGYPMGAVIIREDLSNLLGEYYFNTFGGNSVACAVASCVLEEIEEKNLMYHSKIMGDFLISNLKKKNYIMDIMGRGLYIGFKLKDIEKTKSIVNELKEKNIILGIGSDNTIRIKPPLTVTYDDIEMFLETLDILIR